MNGLGPTQTLVSSEAVDRAVPASPRTAALGDQAAHTKPAPPHLSMTVAGRATYAARSLAVLNPATEEVAGYAPDASDEVFEEAVASARAAFRSWRRTSVGERRQAVRGIATELRTHVAELADLLTAEQGKPLKAATLEILGAATACEGVADLEIPVGRPEDNPIRRAETRYDPLGVVGAIAPWNFPVTLAMWKVAPALLAGNAVILKPSPFTPLTTLRIGELLREHLPPGLLNVISGGPELGPLMTNHPGIDKISFTGSTETGSKVMAAAAQTLKHVTLELGGNDAAIVLADAELDAIIEPLFWSAFRNSGQICVATKRLYVHEVIYDEVAARLVALAAKVRMGNGADPEVDLGPVQNRPQFERVCGILEDARRRGLTFLAGGEAMDRPGYFVPLTLVDDPPEDSRIVAEEQFGPVLPLLRFRDIDEVVARANASAYGLAGSVWTGDIEAGAALARRLETGTVWVNEAQYNAPHLPFAGRKKSGLGVENGVEGLLEYMSIQTVVVRQDQTPSA